MPGAGKLALAGLQLAGLFSVSRAIGLTQSGDPQYQGPLGLINGGTDWVPWLRELRPEAFRQRSWAKGVENGTVLAQSPFDPANVNNPANALTVNVYIDGKKQEPEKVVTDHRGAIK